VGAHWFLAHAGDKSLLGIAGCQFRDTTKLRAVLIEEVTAF